MNEGSMLFTVDDLEEWHARVSKATNTASAINDFQGMVNFNFQDPDGNIMHLRSLNYQSDGKLRTSSRQIIVKKLLKISAVFLLNNVKYLDTK